MDARYNTQLEPAKYEDEGMHARLAAHREAMQKRAAGARMEKRAPESRRNPEDARVYASRKGVPSWAGSGTTPSLDQSAVSQAEITALAATCASCLSSSAMAIYEGTVYCSLCNRKALIPRITPEAKA